LIQGRWNSRALLYSHSGEEVPPICHVSLPSQFTPTQRIGGLLLMDDCVQTTSEMCLLC